MDIAVLFFPFSSHYFTFLSPLQCLVVWFFFFYTSTRESENIHMGFSHILLALQLLTLNPHEQFSCCPMGQRTGTKEPHSGTHSRCILWKGLFSLNGTKNHFSIFFSSEMCFAQNPRQRRHERWIPVLVSQTMESVLCFFACFTSLKCQAGLRCPAFPTFWK